MQKKRFETNATKPLEEAIVFSLGDVRDLTKGLEGNWGDGSIGSLRYKKTPGLDDPTTILPGKDEPVREPTKEPDQDPAKK